MRALTSEDFTYGAVVESTGLEVIAETSVGDYEGELLYVVKDGDQYSLISLSYGSCGGCDFMEAYYGSTSESDLAELEKYRESLMSGNVWYSKKEFEEYLTNKDFSLEWYYYSDKESLKDFVQEVLGKINVL